MTNKQWLLGYETGFNDGFRAVCDECWAKGYDEGVKEAAIEAQ
jgi:hypothetical protein